MEGTRRLGLGCQSGSCSGDGDWRPANGSGFSPASTQMRPPSLCLRWAVSWLPDRAQTAAPSWLERHRSERTRSENGVIQPVRHERGTSRGSRGSRGIQACWLLVAGCWCGGKQAHAAKKRGQEYLQRCSMPSNRKAFSPSGRKGLHRVLGNPRRRSNDGRLRLDCLLPQLKKPVLSG